MAPRPSVTLTEADPACSLPGTAKAVRPEVAAVVTAAADSQAVAVAVAAASEAVVVAVAAVDANLGDAIMDSTQRLPRSRSCAWGSAIAMVLALLTLGIAPAHAQKISARPRLR